MACVAGDIDPADDLGQRTERLQAVLEVDVRLADEAGDAGNLCAAPVVQVRLPLIVKPPFQVEVDVPALPGMEPIPIQVGGPVSQPAGTTPAATAT